MTGVDVASRASSLAEDWGLSVFPVKLIPRADGRTDKKPLTEHGFYDASKNLDQIHNWWGRWPDAVVGVPTGRASKLFIVDIDPEGEAWYRENASRLECGRVHRTQRGWHLLYAMPDGQDISNSAGKVVKGVDVRGTGGYMVWWPASGGESVGDLDDIKPAPAWLLSLIQSKPVAVPEPTEAGKFGPGQRNDFLSREAYRHRQRGATGPELFSILSAINDARCSPPVDAQELQTIIDGKIRLVGVDATLAPKEEEESPAPKAHIDWAALEHRVIPSRQWIIDHWLGMGHVTLLSGAGGLGKTGVAQSIGSCVAVGADYLDNVADTRTVLMWACEDDEDELSRRQLSIASALTRKVGEFAPNFKLFSYDGEDVELCCLKDGVVAFSPMIETLSQQIGDLKPGLVILDNIARLYGCNENDRHQVTTFIAMLTRAARVSGAGVLLLGHPAKGIGSEYSGSTAWEGAVRARWYLGRNLPDKEPAEDLDGDDTIRYLCRRKANYSSTDYRIVRYVNGAMIPDDPMRPVTQRPTEYAQDVVVRAIMALERMGKWGNASGSSPDFLPKLAHAYNLTAEVSSKQFGNAMRELEMAGKISMEVVGQYQNRTPKKGFKVKS